MGLAQGDGVCTEDSDRDLIALVDEKMREIERALEDIAYRVMWDYAFNPVISLKDYTEIDLRSATERGVSFDEYIETEGIPI